MAQNTTPTYKSTPTGNEDYDRARSDLDDAIDELEALDREWEARKNGTWDNNLKSFLSPSQDMYASNNDIKQEARFAFDPSVLNSYSESNYTPGSTHIDYYNPYRSYVSTRPLNFLVGGTLKPNYVVEDAKTENKSYLVRPVGPFKLPSQALDYEKLIKALFTRRNTGILENVLSTMYESMLRLGGMIKKHQEGDVLENAPSQKELAKLFKKRYINDLELQDPIYTTKEEDELLDQYYLLYYKIKEGMATYIDGEYNEEGTEGPQEEERTAIVKKSKGRTNWEPDYYINDDDDLEIDESEYTNEYSDDSDEEEYEEEANDNIDNFLGDKGQFIYDFINDGELSEYDIKIRDENYDKTLLEYFKSKINDYVESLKEENEDSDKVFSDILEESPKFKEYLLNGMLESIPQGVVTPSYESLNFNSKNPYERFPKEVRHYIDPMLEMYYKLLDAWKKYQSLS